MSTIQADIEARLAEVEPDVEVLLAEVVGGDLVRLFIDHPAGRHARPLRARDPSPARGARAVRARGLLARDRAPALQARALPPLRRQARACPHARRPRRPPLLHGRAARTPPTTRSPWPPTPASCRSPTPTSIVRTSWETEDHVRRDRRSSQDSRAREGHLRGEADGRARGRAPVRLQEAARRGALRPRAHGPRLRRLHRRGVPPARGARGPAARRGRGAGHGRARAPRGPGDRRGHHPGGAGHRSRRA